jgi:prolyl oligopeptidase
MELENIPNFRRFSGYTAFVEGWGLYSESLGEELDLYQDPYSKFGALTYDMWRAVRLVVDTGMHYKGWSRDQAIEFFTANAAKTEQDIINEIDRYLIMPGQALAYKIGQLKILELKRKSRQQLGEEFDIKEFHHVVLGEGALPLNVLEERVDQYIESFKG